MEKVVTPIAMNFKSHFRAIFVFISLAIPSTLIYGQSTCSCDFVNNSSPNCVVESATSGRCNPVACQPSFVCDAEGSSTCDVSTERRSILRFAGNVGQDQPCEQVSATVAVITRQRLTQQVNVFTGFDFLFDDTMDSTLTPPYVGSGNFTFDDFQNKPDGTYNLTSLPNYEFFFVIHGITFTNDNLLATSTLVKITTVGGERFVTFDSKPYFYMQELETEDNWYDEYFDSLIFLSFETQYALSINSNEATYTGSFTGSYVISAQPTTGTESAPV